MAAVSKIDSNSTGLRYAEEVTPGVLPGTPTWFPLEPNSYDDFGGEISTIARNPINDSRQRKKGVVTDLDAVGGFQTDLTQENMQDLLQGFFFASLRRKGEEIVTAVDIDAGNDDEYEVAETAGFLVGSLIKGKNFSETANNAVNVVTAVVVDTSVEVADGQLAAEAVPPADAQITVVGHQGASADLDIDATGSLPALTSTVLDFTTLGLIPGEWLFIGGDNAANQFVTAANNGFKRIRSIAANRIEFDKSDLTMVDETGTGLSINLYFGRVLKNELGSLITKRTYQLERSLGAPDDAFPAQIQSEYVTGAAPGEATFNMPTADKLTLGLSFLGQDAEQRDAVTGLKSGNRPGLVEADAFNTSSDFSRIRMATVQPGVEAPTALFAFLQDLTITVNNNLQSNKALGVLGSCGISSGTFQVGGSLTAYFADIASVQAVRNNADVTLDIIMVKANAGILIDLPLITLGNGKPNVEQDQPITLPLDMDAATAAKIDPTLDYTAMMVFFDALPNAADT